MGTIGLLLVRVTMGWLMVLWGLDKIVNVEHSVRVAQAFYLGLGATAWIQTGFGVLQVILGILVILGFQRRYTYPGVFLIALVTALGVWRSILDPWGWVLDGSNVLFYPSAIVLAASVVLWGMLDEDETALDNRST
jgi:uncharacterized membrane protein YphA (DoxX/SURF4 family)